jgi:homoserine dehydrogenase
VEVIGGSDGPAKDAIEAAIAHRKHIVTANKALLAEHGNALAMLAERSGVALRYEAAVAGGIPIVKALVEGLAGNQITRVMGVMNGTCNYILTTMEDTGAAYEDVLADAQALGYAEAAPAFDVGGFDAAQKLALLSASAFGTQVDYGGVKIEGIERVSLADIRQAATMGYRIKLLGVARMNGDKLEQRMQPCLVPATSPVGQLEGVTNMVVVEGDFIGQTVYQGPGAGEGPTASAVLGDIVDIARGARIPSFGVAAEELQAVGSAETGVDASYYLRFTVEDVAGVLARLAEALGAEGISVSEMSQPSHEGAQAEILIVTHPCSRAALDTALTKVTQNGICVETPVALRIERV